IPVDIAGHPADYGNLNKLSLAHSFKIVSDSAHSFGATFDGKAMPLWTDATVYSFYSTKNLTTAEGGAVVSRRQELIDKVRLLAKHGLTSNAYDRKMSGGWKYDASILGYKANMSDVHAAIGLGELTVFAANQEKKAKLAERYLKNLQPVSELIKLPRVDENCEHAWHLFIIQLELKRLGIDRNQFIIEMNEHGIECGVHYQPIFDLSYYSNFFSLSLDEYPHAAKAGESAVSLPLYPTLKATDVDRVCESIIEILSVNSR
ncbi:MAG TPA: DegT/DnrJ/EryC1/StrS aminotransferase family protein, partial [candidate division Zixibacteria bacterium]|nr:DegT/DnrJ/EryC1/StrS aminotransferase family protein [candidate division Zixibacteria bacterium]